MKHIVETKLQINGQKKSLKNIRDFDIFSSFEIEITFFKCQKFKISVES